jgi:hypothetical protein
LAEAAGDPEPNRDASRPAAAAGGAGDYHLPVEPDHPHQPHAGAIRHFGEAQWLGPVLTFGRDGLRDQGSRNGVGVLLQCDDAEHCAAVGVEEYDAAFDQPR